MTHRKEAKRVFIKHQSASLNLTDSQLNKTMNQLLMPFNIE